MTAGEAVVLRDGSWAATLCVYVFALVRAQCTKPSRLATSFAYLLGFIAGMALDTHECSSGKSCG